MAELTQQEMFDRVAAHLLKQGRKSKDLNDCCSYRSQDGAMCAIGVLIDDSEYDEHMEGWPVSYIYRDVGAIGPGNLELANSLQLLHDTAPLCRWSEALKKLASEFNLDASVLEVPNDG